MRRKRSERGFTLVEIIVAVAIVAILVAIAIPLFRSSRRKTDLQDVAPRLVGHLGQARGLAATGLTHSTWGPNQRTECAGLRIISASQYAVFIDADLLANGNEVDAAIIDFGVNHPGSPLSVAILAPPATTE